MTRKIIENHLKKIVSRLFGIELTPTQAEIIKDIVLKKHNRIIITAMTRYGKSFTLAIATILYILHNINKKVILIAPTHAQTTIIKNHIANLIAKSQIVQQFVDFETYEAERLKKEVSKRRITFKNGCELLTLSAEGKAERLMGFGGDLIIIDESPLISDEVYRKRILRMLGDHPEESILVEIGNPFFKNHFWENWSNPRFKKYHIGWKLALKEGRTTKLWIEEQKSILTPTEFRILYEAEFPEDDEDSLFKYRWITEAQNKQLYLKKPRLEAGLDVAEMGRDYTVLTMVETDGINYVVKEIHKWEKQDTMKTVSRVINKIDKKTLIRVDATGVGKGVYDRLKELGYNAVEIKSARKPKSDRFINLKAENYWKLRKLFEEGRIQIPKHSDLVNQLLKMKYEISTSGKIKIIDPEDKSPDFADSLTLAVSNKGNIVVGIAKWGE